MVYFDFASFFFVIIFQRERALPWRDSFYSTFPKKYNAMAYKDLTTSDLDGVRIQHRNENGLQTTNAQAEISIW